MLKSFYNCQYLCKNQNFLNFLSQFAKKDPIATIIQLSQLQMISHLNESRDVLSLVFIFEQFRTNERWKFFVR